MKLAHLADPHLGRRAYTRLSSRGINQREADAATAFRLAIDGVIAAKPDAVVIAGDLFDAVRPSNHSIVFAFRQLQRLIDGLPGVPIVLIAGNHDHPRTTESGSILALFEDLGVQVATATERAFIDETRSLHILAVPHAALVGERPAMRPDPTKRYNVLVLHGEAQGILSVDAAALEHGGVQITPEEVRPDLWSYTAWGHYHVQREVAPRAWYAGSLEYVSSNIWGELHEEQLLGVQGKGWLLVDLETGTVERMPIVAPRRVIDLPSVDAAEMDAAALDAAIKVRIDRLGGKLTDAVARLVARNVPRHIARQLDHARIRQWKTEALHFHLDLRRPDNVERPAFSGAPGRRQTLPDVVADYLRARPLPADLDRERFITLGTTLLADASAEAADA